MESMEMEVRLEAERKKKIIKGLNEVLANQQIFHQNLKKFQWLILGEEFNQLHAEYEELCSTIEKKMEITANRIKNLGGKPFNINTKYIKTSELKIFKNITSTKETIDIVMHSILTIVSNIKSVMAIVIEAKDLETIKILKGLTKEYKKTFNKISAFSAEAD